MQRHRQQWTQDTERRQAKQATQHRKLKTGSEPSECRITQGQVR